MALQNLHEMIRNLSAYIKSLEVVCENGVRLAKNFERLLSPGPVVQPGGGATSSSTFANLDSDVLTQSVATWELAHKIATSDANALISELLPLLQEAVQNAMKDPGQPNSNTYEVFRSCFSAFFQIQWRFCSLYLQCSSSQGNGVYPGGGSFPKSPDIARSPTTTSFSSGDRRESTESCISSFSMPRSSISGLSALSSRSSSPAPHHHGHHYTHRSRNSSPSVKFTPSQPPSPLMPYGDGSYPYLFRRWSAHTHNFNNQTMGSGQSNSSNLSGAGSYVSSHNSSVFSSGLGSSRRWSVPANAGTQHQAGSTANTSSFNSWAEPREPILGFCDLDSHRRLDPAERSFECGLLDAINLLSSKPTGNYMQSKIPRHHPEDTIDEFGTLEHSTSLWPPSETMPGVILTTCTETDPMLNLDILDSRRHHSLCVPFGAMEGPKSPGSPISPCSPCTPHLSTSGEYSLFGGAPSHTQSS